MPTEDFGYYTEVDTDNVLTVTTSRCTFDGLQMNWTQDYVYKDFGPARFGTNWTHTFDVCITTAEDQAVAVFYAQSNEIDYWGSLANGFGVYFQVEGSGAYLDINLKDIETANADSYLNTSHSITKTYYMKLVRNGTSLALYIYSDSARTTLIDTLSITITNNNYRIIIPASTYTGGGLGATEIDGYIENLNLDASFRTTQCYAKVNYTPAASTVTLTMPSSLQVGHSRQVSRHTFPSGNYQVDDYGRSGKTLTMSSVVTDSASDTMQSMKDICHNGAAVTIAGLPDSNLNTDYHVVDFNFSQEGGESGFYRWGLVLEED